MPVHRWRLMIKRRKRMPRKNTKTVKTMLVGKNSVEKNPRI